MTVEKAFYYIEKAVDYYALPACDKAFALIKARIKELEAERAELLGRLCRIEGRPSRSNCIPPTVQHDPELPTPPEEQPEVTG